MVFSAQLTAVLAGALALVVAIAIAFGHRYSDKRSKLDENNSELNEIRIGIRTEATTPRLDKIYRYLVQTEAELRQARLATFTFDSGSLLYDVNRRGYFNRLINELEETFTESANIKNTWLSLRSNYGRLGGAVYGFAVVVGVGGYGLLIVSSDYITGVTTELTLTLVSVFAVALVVVAVLIIWYHGKMQTNLLLYATTKDKYLVERTRL